MRLRDARRPLSFLGVKSLTGVDDMLLVENEGPKEVRSVNLEVCADCDSSGVLPLLPWKGPGPTLPDQVAVVSMRGVG